MKSPRSIFACMVLLFPFFLIAQADLYQKTEILLEKNKPKEAIRLLVPHLEKHQEDHEARLLYGRSLIKTGEHESAIVELKTIKKAMAERSDYHFWYGQAYLGKLNASKNFFEKGIIASKVKEAFERSVDLDPENLTARNSLAQYYLSAPGIAGGSVKKAKEQIDFIKSRDPRMGYYAMASYYFQKKEYALAREEYLNYLDKASQKSEVLYQIGFTYQLEKNYPSAFEYFSKSLAKNDVFIPSYYQYARTAVFSEKNVAKGIEMMKVYIDKGGAKNGPDVPSAYWRLGLLYELDGKNEEAKHAYKKALEIDPEHEEALKALAKVN